MRVLISISEQDYGLACNHPDTLFGSYAKSIKKGIPILDNATNGDIIKAMFPNGELEERGLNIYYSIEHKVGNYCKVMDMQVGTNEYWWNAPYKEKEQ